MLRVIRPKRGGAAALTPDEQSLFEITNTWKPIGPDLDFAEGLKELGAKNRLAKPSARKLELTDLKQWGLVAVVTIGIMVLGFCFDQM